MNNLISIIFIGAGATALIDLWAIARRRLLGVPLPNYGFIGRWIGHLPGGKLHHDSIAAAPPVRGERALGWIAHYLIGIGFAALLPAFWGVAWIREPAIVPALVVGIGTVAAPFLVLQPAMGAGFAASRTPRPGAARLQSLITHGIFGLGLYIAGRLINTVLTGD